MTRSTAFIAERPDEMLTFNLGTKKEIGGFWTDAASPELSSLSEIKTGILVPRSQASNVFTARWFFWRRELVSAEGIKLENFKPDWLHEAFKRFTKFIMKKRLLQS